MTDIERVTMTPQELESAESVIEHGLKTFVDVGQALMAIRDGRGYRHTGYQTFEDYCQERWNMRHQNADRLIRSAQVAGVLNPIGFTVTESQARSLVPVLRQEGPQAVTAVWQEAVETAPNGKLTAAHVAAVVEERTERTLSVDRAPSNQSPDKSRTAVKARQERIAQMAEEGYREDVIAREVGLDEETVRANMHRLGIPTLASKIGWSRRVNANRVMEGIVTSATPSEEAIGALDWNALDESQFQDWDQRLSEAIRVLTNLRNKLRARIA